jgi:hypothetical protein
MRTIRAALGAALLASSAAGAEAGPMACEREMTRAAAATGVPRLRRGEARHRLGESFGLAYLDFKAEEVAIAAALAGDAPAGFGGSSSRRRLSERTSCPSGGARLIDIGCMQINAHYHSAAPVRIAPWRVRLLCPRC